MFKMLTEMSSILFESTLKLRSCLSVRKDRETQRASRQDAKEKSFTCSSLEKATKRVLRSRSRIAEFDF